MVLSRTAPQRVFVSLDYAPFVYRLDDDGTLTAHTGRIAHAPVGASLDEEQNLTLVTELGPGIVDDRDLEALTKRLGSPSGASMDDGTLEAELAAAAAGHPAMLGLAWEGGGVTPSGSSRRSSSRPASDSSVSRWRIPDASAVRGEFRTCKSSTTFPKR